MKYFKTSESIKTEEALEVAHKLLIENFNFKNPLAGSR